MVVGACLLVLAVGVGQANAQNASDTGFTLEDIEMRDNLIAAQETLLNVYRCQFGIDILAVSGGCTNGWPSQGFSRPTAFQGVVTLDDIEDRDELIAAQESVLNTYRCRYDFETDIKITPDGCPDLSDPTGPELLVPFVLDALDTSELLDRDIPRGLITPTGVSVAVLGVNEGRFVVATPCGNISTVSSGLPLDGVRVVVDPGHGGSYDVGAVGPNGLAERDLNLTLSHAVLRELASRGIPAASTRMGHYGTPLSVRAAFADALGAEALISIHHNAPTSTIGGEPGTEVFVQSMSAQQARANSVRLGGLLQEEITSALAGFDNISWSRAHDAGVLRVLLPDGRDAYGMIRRPATPTALVEYGYLSNSSEAALFATDEYIQVAAKATANAIEVYLNTDRTGAEPVERPRVFDPARAPTRCNEVVLE